MIHSHPVWATMFAVAHQPIPACIDEFAVYFGGEIRCAEYAASGTPDVGHNAVKALEGRAAALIANHGLVAVGPRPDKALHVTALVERTAQIVWGARALGGPVPIPDKVNQDFAAVYTLPAPEPDVGGSLSRERTESAIDTPANSVQTRSLARVVRPGAWRDRRSAGRSGDAAGPQREPLAVGCCAAHTDASSPQQRCGDRIHHPLKSIAAPGDWGGASVTMRSSSP